MEERRELMGRGICEGVGMVSRGQGLTRGPHWEWPQRTWM